MKMEKKLFKEKMWEMSQNGYKEIADKLELDTNRDFFLLKGIADLMEDAYRVGRMEMNDEMMEG